MTASPQPDAEAEVLSLLATDARTSDFTFEDDLYRRVETALVDRRCTDLDLAVLLRHLLRRWSLRDGRSAAIAASPSIAQRVAGHAAAVGLRQDASLRWTATPWAPLWLAADNGTTGVPDAAAAAGTSVGRRFREDPLTADPFFADATGFATYRTTGQRAACRAAVSSPPGSCTIAMLPTGSGKTEVALTLALQRKQALTLLVVPTVALAYDFERRLRDHFARGRDACDSTLPARSTAWATKA